jgi:ferredoxin
MSVEIIFEPAGGNGLVAEGTYIWEAAKRLGVGLTADCNGRGECDSCTVTIERGADLLSPASSAEVKLLGLDRLCGAERLACQAKLEKQGGIVVRLTPIREAEPKQSEAGKSFRGLPLKEKVGALIELEAVTITGALNSLRGGYHSLIDKFLNLTPQTENEAKATKKNAKEENSNR